MSSIPELLILKDVQLAAKYESNFEEIDFFVAESVHVRERKE